MAQEAWRAYLELAYGMTEATTKKATKTVRRLVGKSGATAEQLQSMAEDLLRAGSANREALTKLVRYELDRALGAVGLATAEEVSALTTRVHELEAQLREATVNAVAPPHEPAPPVGAEAIPAAPVVAKKTVAKKVAAPVKTAAKAVPAKAAAPAKAATPAKVAAAAKAAPARRTPAKKAAAIEAIETVAAASEAGPASDKLPVKKATRAPRKTAS
ncbi:phasin family protein [Dactylosporangium sp. CA-092794]|uniref:phasin family protein n=1 Tax=Dactylosporangium sp. CA-092794 TaxID=3239929 RepID=UPI003D91BA05